MELAKVNKETENLKQVKYFAIHLVYIIVSIIFLTVGIISLLHYDYGLLSFLFAIPQFFLTGALPILIALLLIFMAIIDSEKVSISSNEDTLTVQVSLIRKRTKKYKLSSIKYVGLKNKETKTLRWIIIFVLMLITIEILLQNTMDLLNFARIAPILLICTILMFIGIPILILFPRRFIEIGTNEESIFIPYKNLPRSKTEKLLQLLDVSTNILEQPTIFRKIYRNIRSQFLNSILSIFLIGIGIILIITPLFFGTFTRVITLTLGLKLFSRIINSDRYFPVSETENLYLGDSLRLTFMQTTDAKVERTKSLSPLNFHPLEIICILYLIAEAIRYGFRNFWWAYAEFSFLYFFIGIVFISLIFVKWFNPITILNVQFQDFSIKIRESKISELTDESFIKNLSKKAKLFLDNLKTLSDNKYLSISIILFTLFIIWPIFYNVFGGNFLFI